MAPEQGLEVEVGPEVVGYSSLALHFEHRQAELLGFRDPVEIEAAMLEQ